MAPYWIPCGKLEVCFKHFKTHDTCTFSFLSGLYIQPVLILNKNYKTTQSNGWSASQMLFQTALQRFLCMLK